MTPDSIAVLPEILRVLELEGNAILLCRKRLMEHPALANAFEKAIDYLYTAIRKGGKIIVTGIGKSGKVGQKIAATLCSTGSPALYLHPTEGMHGDLGLIHPSDAILALSHTGNTDEIIRILPFFRRLHVPIVGLGGNIHSRLASECDAWIDSYVDQEACPHQLTPTTSTTVALALGDAIAVILMQLRGFQADAFAKNHPGGSLGKKLNFTVADLMHRGSQVPIVHPDTSVEETLQILTQCHLGAVLVVQEKHLAGLITDGDIRRALKHREKFFQLRAMDIMTQNPVTILPEILAQTALQLMEDRPLQISVLPVINAKNEWQGLIRLHDLVKEF